MILTLVINQASLVRGGAMMLAALFSFPAAHAACPKPDQQIEVQRQQRIEGQVEAGVVAFKAAASGESEQQSVWQAQLPSQDVLDQQWKLYMLCQARERGDIDPVTHCKLVRAVLGQLSGVAIEADTCTAPPQVPGATGSTPPTAAAAGGGGTTCPILRKIDDIDVTFKGLLANDALLTWDAESSMGWFTHYKLKGDLVRVSGGGDLEHEMNYFEGDPLPETDVQGWRVAGDTFDPALVNATGLRLRIEDLTDSRLATAYLMPTAKPILLTVSSNYESRNSAKLRTWAVDPLCLPR